MNIPQCHLIPCCWQTRCAIKTIETEWVGSQTFLRYKCGNTNHSLRKDDAGCLRDKLPPHKAHAHPTIFAWNNIAKKLNAFSVSPAAKAPRNPYKVERSQNVLLPASEARPSSVHNRGENKAAMVPSFLSKISTVNGVVIHARNVSLPL